MGQCQRHLGQTVAKADRYDRDDKRGDERAAEVAGRQAIVLTEEVAENDGADLECPQRPYSGEAPGTPFLERLRSDLLIGHALHGLLIRHGVASGQVFDLLDNLVGDARCTAGAVRSASK